MFAVARGLQLGARRSTAPLTRTQPSRFMATGKQSARGFANSDTLFYVAAVAVGTVGLSYAAVPLYRLFCQVGRVTVGRGAACSPTVGLA
jgi:cytochrome c oxidase assembly protein subunit 11